MAGQIKKAEIIDALPDKKSVTKFVEKLPDRLRKRCIL
jgi:hypothetical protein